MLREYSKEKLTDECFYFSFVFEQNLCIESKYIILCEFRGLFILQCKRLLYSACGTFKSGKYFTNYKLLLQTYLLLHALFSTNCYRSFNFSLQICLNYIDNSAVLFYFARLQPTAITYYQCQRSVLFCFELHLRRKFIK